MNSKIKIGFALGSLLALAPVADAAASTPSFGICAHVSRDEFDIREREFEMMRDAGITRVRTDFDWATIEPRPGEWHFEKFDRLMDDAARFGIRILPVLGFDNPGAYPGIAREHLEEWRRYVRAVMERYGGSLDVVEVWNEPNLRSFWRPQPDAAQYAAFLKTTYETIKTVSPQTRVMLGGTAGADTAFIEGICRGRPIHGHREHPPLFVAQPAGGRTCPRHRRSPCSHGPPRRCRKADLDHRTRLAHA